MSEKIPSALDAMTLVVLSYRPADKGLASAKIARRVKRAAKKGSHDDREPSM